MTGDEGYVKFTTDWRPGPPPASAAVHELERWRRPLFEAGLIGHDESLGVGYGNLSLRAGERQFVVSGTQTGHIATTTGEHYALVTDYDIAGNRVVCTGPVQASSESLTHAAIYEADPAVCAVVHAHHTELWRRGLHCLPTTRADAAYGTPAMALELLRLYRETEFARVGVAVMAGHDDGIVGIGPSLESAATRLLALLQKPG